VKRLHVGNSFLNAKLNANIMQEIEIWKDIPNYEIYQVSSFGRIKLKNYRNTGNERIIKPSMYKNYLGLYLGKKDNRKFYLVHQLIAIVFLNHKPNGHKLVINHIDFNKQNNNINNLELITARQNTNRKHLKHTSIYTGVHWHKVTNKWTASIVFNNKKKYLGLFENEIDAHLKYEHELKKILTNEL
jgi:hypothetical protein